MSTVQIYPTVKGAMRRRAKTEADRYSQGRGCSPSPKVVSHRVGQDKGRELQERGQHCVL